jgi:hypothetical protein
MNEIIPAPVSPNVTVCHTPAERPDEPEVLTDRQLLALELILSGKTDPHVARAVGVCRRTVLRWRNSDAEFIAELRRRRKAAWRGVTDKLRALLDPAVDVLAEQLTDPYERTRFRAASTLLRLANVKAAIAPQEDES